MSALNEIQITDFIFSEISPFLYGKINGKVYHKGYRPSDSTKEDAIIVFSAGIGNQYQEGFIYINIYCKDIDCGIGHKVENRDRLRTFLSWDKEIVAHLNKFVGFYWTLDETSKIITEEETKEHFASIKLRFNRYNKN